MVLIVKMFKKILRTRYSKDTFSNSGCNLIPQMSVEMSLKDFPSLSIWMRRVILRYAKQRDVVMSNE